MKKTQDIIKKILNDIQRIQGCCPICNSLLFISPNISDNIKKIFQCQNKREIHFQIEEYLNYIIFVIMGKEFKIDLLSTKNKKKQRGRKKSITVENSKDIILKEIEIAKIKYKRSLK